MIRITPGYFPRWSAHSFVGATGPADFYFISPLAEDGQHAEEFLCLLSLKNESLPEEDIFKVDTHLFYNLAGDTGYPLNCLRSSFRFHRWQISLYSLKFSTFCSVFVAIKCWPYLGLSYLVSSLFLLERIPPTQNYGHVARIVGTKKGLQINVYKFILVQNGPDLKTELFRLRLALVCGRAAARLQRRELPNIILLNTRLYPY